MPKGPFTNIVGGQFQVSEQYAVISLIAHKGEYGESHGILVECVLEGHLQLHWMTLKPKHKSAHAEVVYKPVDLKELEKLEGIKYHAKQMPFSHLKDLIAQISSQQKQEVKYTKAPKTNAITFTCRSWHEPHKDRSSLEWCLALLTNINYAYNNNSWEKFKLDKTDAKEIKSVSHLLPEPPASSNNPSTLFSPPPETPSSCCKAAEKYLQDKKYADAVVQFKRGLALNKTHRTSKIGCLLTLQEMVMNAYNNGENKDYQAARIYITDMLSIDENDSFAKDGKILIDAKLNPVPAAAKNQLPVREAREIKKLPFPIENLVFQGGGIKGLAYSGVLNELLNQEYDFKLEQIKRIGGASAGAITALALGIGYSMEETNEILATKDFTDFFDGPYKEAFIMLNQRQKEIAAKFKTLLQGNLVSVASRAGTAYSSDDDVKIIKEGLNILKEEDFGLFEGKVIRQWFDDLIRRKTGGVKQADGKIEGGIKEATFRELHDLKEKEPDKYKDFKEMYFVSVNLNTNQIEVFSYEHTPDVIVSDAARASMSIPLVYKAHKIHYKNASTVYGPEVYSDGHLYVDGGLLSNLPMWLFDHGRYLPIAIGDNHQINPYTLGFKLVNPDKKAIYEGGEKLEHATPNNILNYVKQVAECIFTNRERIIPGEEHHERLMFIDNKGVKTTEFALKPWQRDRLLLAGKQGVQDYFKRLKDKDFNHLLPVQIHHHYLDYLDVNRLDGDNNTLLHTAVRNGDVSVVAYLCIYRHQDIQDKKAKNRAQETVWDIAEKLKHAHKAEIINLLNRSGFNPAHVINEAQKAEKVAEVKGNYFCPIM